MQRAFGKVMVLPDRAWRTLTWGWAALFVTSGGLNLYVVYHFTEGAWVTYKFASGFVMPVLLVASSVGYLAATKQLPTAPADDASGGGAEST